VEVGYLDADDRVGAEVTCWSVVHGFSVLNVEGPLRGMRDVDRQAALTAMLLGVDRGLGRPGECRSWAAEGGQNRRPAAAQLRSSGKGAHAPVGSAGS
jgi:hypothetical protein